MTLLTSFLDMGGYAPYVWPAYGVSIAALLAVSVLSYRKMKSLEGKLKTLKDSNDQT